MLEDKTTRTRKKKDEKMQDCINVLNHYQVGNANKIYMEMMEVLIGNEKESKVVKIV